MKIVDGFVFLDHRKSFRVQLKDGGSKDFIIALNVKTGLFYKIMALIAEKDTLAQTGELPEFCAEIVADLLATKSNLYNAHWVKSNIEELAQIEIINKVVEGIAKLLDNDCFIMPEIKVEKEQVSSNDESAKKRQKKRNSIESLRKLIAADGNNCLLNEIALITSRTNNSYSEIMNMPILVFKGLAKNIVLSDMRSDEDYELAYLKNEAQKNGADDKKNKATKKPDAPKKGANLKALQAFED